MNGPLLAWPGWRHLGLTLLIGIPLCLWWLAVYVGTDWITAQRTFRVRVHLDAELAMPFCPPFVLFYNSIYLLYAQAPFVLRQRRPLLAFGLTHATVVGVAGLCFLLFPAELAYDSPPEGGVWEGMLSWTRRVALTYNLAPSLHVALTVACVAVYAPRGGIVGKTVLWGWALAIAASTLLTHQHHVLDVLTGWALGLAGKRLVFDRFS